MSLLIKKILNKIKVFEERTQDSGWQDLTLLTGWQNHSAGQNPAQYEKKNRSCLSAWMCINKHRNYK